MSLPEFWRGQRPAPFTNDWFNLFERTFEDLGRLPAAAWANKEWAKLNPKCEATESKTHYNFKFDIPGLTKDQIKIELHDNRLTVSGERKEEKKEEDKDRKTHLSEVFYGSFMRTFDLPTPVNSERVEAKYDNGVLAIAVPKETATSARQITIR